MKNFALFFILFSFNIYSSFSLSEWLDKHICPKKATAQPPITIRNETPNTLLIRYQKEKSSEDNILEVAPEETKQLLYPLNTHMKTKEVCIFDIKATNNGCTIGRFPLILSNTEPVRSIIVTPPFVVQTYYDT